MLSAITTRTPSPMLLSKRIDNVFFIQFLKKSLISSVYQRSKAVALITAITHGALCSLQIYLRVAVIVC